MFLTLQDKEKSATGFGWQGCWDERWREVSLSVHRLLLCCKSRHICCWCWPLPVLHYFMSCSSCISKCQVASQDRSSPNCNLLALFSYCWPHCFSPSLSKQGLSHNGAAKVVIVKVLPFGVSIWNIRKQITLTSLQNGDSLQVWETGGQDAKQKLVKMLGPNC
jgi:hypothetical protein